MTHLSDLLYLAHRVPYPPDKGEKIRAFHVLKHLAKDFRVHLGCFADDPEDEQHAEALKVYCASVVIVPLHRKQALARGLAGLAMGGSLSEFYFRDARMTRFVAETMARVRPENLFLYCSAMAPYALPYARSHRIVLDMVDVDSEKYRAYAEKSAWPLNWLFRRESRALLGLERRAAMAFDRSLFVSDAEAQAFLARAPEAEAKTGHFSNGVDLGYFDPGHPFVSPFAPESTAIVFTGTMDYRPNIEAVEWFTKEAFPLIVRAHLDAEFWIVGSNPAPSVKRLAQQRGVRVTGRVPDVRPYLAHAGCVVAPLHIARGVQNKVLEAMAMAAPVVATPAACEGISAVAGEHVLVAGTPIEFADAVSSVLSGGAAGLGQRARARVETEYDWPRNLTVLDGLFGNTASSRIRESRLPQAAGEAVFGVAS